MKQISLLLLTLCIFSCANEADLNIEPNEPTSELENFISTRSQDGLLGPNPLVILDGALKTVQELELEGFLLNEGETSEVAVINPGNDEILRIFGKSSADGIVLIRTKEPDSSDKSAESLLASKVLILVNGKPTAATELASLFSNKVASVHVTKNSSMLSELAKIGYEGIVQIETK